MTELSPLQAEILRPWITLGGESLVREIGLWEDPEKMPLAWGPLYKFFHASIELEVQGGPEFSFVMGLKIHRAWTGFFSQESFLVARRGDRGHVQLRGPISLVLQAFPQLFGLEATYYLAYRLYFHHHHSTDPLLSVEVDDKYVWSSPIPRNPEGSFGELIPIDPQTQRALELGDMTGIHEDARTALGIHLKIPEGNPPGEYRTFKIKTLERMQETGSWVETGSTQTGQVRYALLQSRPLSRS